MKKLQKKLHAKAESKGVHFVSEKGKRKTDVQRLSELVEGWLERLKRYTEGIHICGDRNSYSKTDHDATFMHMKEDHMQNEQLKPGYNVNVATCSGFVIGSYISADRSDMHALIPFMEQLKRSYVGMNIDSVVVDSGYESEKNYCWFEAHPETELYVKPGNHEQRKHKKYRTDISRRENMAYDAETDTYTCANSSRATAPERRRDQPPLESFGFQRRAAGGCNALQRRRCVTASSSKGHGNRNRIRRPDWKSSRRSTNATIAPLV